MNEELKIIITADVGNFESGTKKAGDSVNKLSNSVDKLKQPVANASFALGQVSNVVKDLPFGFIAIQNNLPGVVESFGQLSKQSGGVGGALKALGGSLLGPAGIAFAFSAVVSSVTALIQNYGSLGNAITALTSTNKAAAESQLLFTKELEKGQGSIGSELITIDLLVKKLTNLKIPYDQRKAAYDELKKVQPEVLAGLERENVLSGNAIPLLLKNAEARKELLLLKVRENAINAVLNKNAGELLKAENDLNKIKDEAIQFQKIRNELITQEKNGNKAATSEIGLYTQKIAYNKIENDKLSETLKTLQAVQDSYIARLDPALTKISEINSATQAQIETQKKSAKATNDESKALKGKIDRVTELQNALKKQGVQTPISNNREGLTPGATAGIVQGFQGSPIKQSLLDEAATVGFANEEYKKYAETVSTLAAPAIDNLFNSLLSGKNVFQALGDSVKQLVIDIVKAIAKAAILKAITTAVSGGAGAGFFGGLFSALSGSIGGASSPTFGGGGGLVGGIGLSGQVVFVQRGTDLVGVLNRGNSQINRVG